MENNLTISNIIMNSNRVKITYRYKEGKVKYKFYGEFTKSDALKGYGWFQWGAPDNILGKTVHLTEQFVQQWAERWGINAI